MKRRLLCAAVSAVVLSSIQLRAQSAGTSQTTQKARHARKQSLQEQVSALQKELREHDAKLQEEIDLLKAQLAAKSAESAAASQDVQAKIVAERAQSDAAAQQSLTALQAMRQAMDVQSAEIKTTLAQVKTEQLVLKKQVEEPVSLRYKGITLTPGGFLAGESVWRQRAMNADIYTNFNFTPYPSSGEAHTSEWVPSARQTRLSLLASGNSPFGTVKGYFEGDFLSAGTTSNNLQSNSYTLRVRQAWGQASAGRLTFTAGQMWSLLTENKGQALPGQEALPMFFDGNIHVGYTYTRQMGYRLQDVVAPNVTVALSLENSQYQFAATNAPSNFFFGAVGAGPGLNNPTFNYTNQVAPDVLAKVSFDPSFGHFEIGGVARWFRDRYYPNGAPAQNDTKFGGGFVANARFPVTRLLDVGLHLVAGDGTGRYGASLLPDITVKPDGTLEPIRNAQGMSSLEAHPTKKLDIFGYAGTEYAQRTVYRSGTGTLVGYGPQTAVNTGCFTEAAPSGSTGYLPGTGNCVGATRDVTQGSLGYVYRIYNGPAGKLQYGLAYSYLTRSGWYGVGGAPKAVNNFVYTSVRYYLP